MRSYRKRQIVKIYKLTRAKAVRLYPLREIDNAYKKAFECADRVQGRAFGSVMYHLHKIRKVIEI